MNWLFNKSIFIEILSTVGSCGFIILLWKKKNDNCFHKPSHGAPTGDFFPLFPSPPIVICLRSGLPLAYQSM